jgi:hypothetical protein
MAPIIQNKPCYIIESKDEKNRLKTIDVPERIKNKNRDFK